MNLPKAANFVLDWIETHLDGSTLEGDLPELLKECEDDARAAGVSPIKLVDETGTDMKAMIEAAFAAQQIGANRH